MRAAAHPELPHVRHRRGVRRSHAARRSALLHALLFVCGFTLIFIALGASATVLGRLLLHYRIWITRLGGALVVLFGLYLLGVVRVAAFDRERRVHLANKPVGYLGTVLVGVAFGAGWTPCLGPILGAILTYTAATADLSRGLPLLLAYSLGLALPFLLAAVAVERFLETVKRIASVSRARVAGERSAAGHRGRADDVRLLHRHGDVHAGADAGGVEEQAVKARSSERAGHSVLSSGTQASSARDASSSP